MQRREFLSRSLQFAAAGAIVASPPFAVNAIAAAPRTVRDAMWVWAHPKGSYDNAWGLPGNSPMTPVEGAKWLGVPNIIFVHYEGNPKPPLAGVAAEFQAVGKMMWSVTGAGGGTSAVERDEVLALAAKMPNIAGIFLDDFFHFTRGDGKKTAAGEAPASLTVEELRRLRDRLTIDGRRLDLGVTLYTNQLDERMKPHLDLCDVVSLWTWEAAELARLEENFATLQTMMPGKRVLLGLYMWDFGKKKAMPMDMMKKQCDLAMKWLRQGRIEGMIFLATNNCGLKIEAVDWARAWIAEVGDQTVEKGQ